MDEGVDQPDSRSSGPGVGRSTRGHGRHRCLRDAEVILTKYRQVKSAMLASGLDLVAFHNDPPPGNILIGDGLPMKLVDYEFASNNDRAYELAVLVTEMFYGEQQVMKL